MENGKSAATLAMGLIGESGSVMPGSGNRQGLPMLSLRPGTFITGPFLALNGDMILASADITRMIRTPAPAMGTSTTDHPGDFGVVLVDGDAVSSLEEKSGTSEIEHD